MAQSRQVQGTKEVIGAMQQQTISIQTMPLPAPEILERLEMIQPGITKEFMDIARIEQSHRHSMEISQGARDKYSYVWASVTVFFVCLLSAYGFYRGFGTQASSIACTVIVASIIGFIGSRARKS
jgi:uncharacterized membrane protein